jgi:signal transduction histidine kinase/CheY-like chemotaxis protein
VYFPSSVWKLTISIGVASLVLAYLGPLIGGGDSPSSLTLWLPIGLIYAMSMTFGWRALPGTVLGQIVSETVFGTHGLSGAAVLATGNAACCAVLVHWAARKRKALQVPDDEPLDVLATPVLFAQSIGALTVGSLLNAAAGAWVFLTPEVPFVLFISQFMLGDFGGAVLIGPLLMVLASPRSGQWAPRRREYLLTALLSLTAVTALLTVRLGVAGWVFLALLLPTMMFAAARYTQEQAIPLCGALALALVAQARDGFTAIEVGGSEDVALASKGVAVLLMLTALLFTSSKRALDDAVTSLRRVNQVLLRAESVAKIGSWRQDLLRGRVYWSPQVYELFGLTANRLAPDNNEFMNLVHPQDRDRVSTAWDSALSGGAYDLEYRVVANGEVRWIQARAEFEFGEAGKAVAAWGTLQDVTATNIAREAEIARSKAEASSRTKSHFLATLSHEIRTPLNGVIGLARISSEKDLPQAMRLEYLQLLEESAQALHTVISDVLDISKIESGQVEAQVEAFPLWDFLNSIGNTYRMLAEDKGLDSAVEIDPVVAKHVLGDSARIRQILNNYLSNALKFTATGSIKLSARCDGDQIVFEVSDTGIGFEQAEAERLFEMFHQADSSNTRRFGGTGLGLTICRELATHLGGAVGVHSEPGKGSTFWFKLSLPATTPPKDLDVEAIKQATTSEGLAKPLDGLHVLMAEDNRVNALVASRMLEREGAKVSIVENGRAAVEAIQATWGVVGSDITLQNHPRIDLVLMDVHMPEMDGLAAARQIRSAEKDRSSTWRLPIIAMTAGVLVEQIQEARDAGMDDFVSKPVQREKLLQAIKRHAGATDTSSREA